MNSNETSENEDPKIQALTQEKINYNVNFGLSAYLMNQNS